MSENNYNKIKVVPKTETTTTSRCINYAAPVEVPSGTVGILDMEIYDLLLPDKMPK